ncbi:MAG TPA: 8-amino-7-oxononanoate synthase [Steroidobacteraceae bacterium]|nr:8-amino-7-oxononanoate synthase [Steroidobacteraceae bacterium]
MRRDANTLRAALAEIDRHHLRRTRRTITSFPVPDSRAEVVVDGRRVVDFCSNDYLGLARHPLIAKAMSDSAAESGAGSGASHLVTGHGLEHQRLEEELAEFTGRERALLFSTGYMANLAAIATLADRGEVVALDRLNHASLIDGTLISGARFSRYAHGDPADAERVLKEHGGHCTVLATDGVFSMDGDVARLPTLARLARAYKAWLVVDDAHGIGVLGHGGRGLVEQFELDPTEVPVLVGTLGKAFGSFGAFIAGSADLIELLVQKARTYIYTTALPQPVAAATRKALRIAQDEPWRRERVLALAARFRAAARELDLHLAHSESPIQPVILGGADTAVRAQNELLAAGFLVVAIRPPTVPAGTARLRITFSAAHTEDQVDALVEALARIHAQTSKRPDTH